MYLGVVPDVLPLAPALSMVNCGHRDGKHRRVRRRVVESFGNGLRPHNRLVLNSLRRCCDVRPLKRACSYTADRPKFGYLCDASR
jgi:hypothetical protein